MRDALGISETLITDIQIASLWQFFTARNQVAHDLDIKAPEDESFGPRYNRTMTTGVGQCNQVLALPDGFVTAVSEALGGPTRIGRPPRRSKR